MFQDSLESNQAGHFVGPYLYLNSPHNYQQTTRGERFNVDVSQLLKSTLYEGHLKSS